MQDITSSNRYSLMVYFPRKEHYSVLEKRNAGSITLSRSGKRDQLYQMKLDFTCRHRLGREELAYTREIYGKFGRRSSHDYTLVDLLRKICSANVLFNLFMPQKQQQKIDLLINRSVLTKISLQP